MHEIIRIACFILELQVSFERGSYQRKYCMLYLHAFSEQSGLYLYWSKHMHLPTTLSNDRSNSFLQ